MFFWYFTPFTCLSVGSDSLVTGYSALAWAEGQKDLEDAEVVTLEKDPLMIAIANEAIMMAEQASHIRIIEGDPLETYISPITPCGVPWRLLIS
jgi:hypothetical protein